MSIKKLCTSPMGWNSFDCYGCVIHEEDLMSNIDYMAENLLQYGYEYIVVDSGWFSVYNLPQGQKYPAITSAERSYDVVMIDENGRVSPSPFFFPSGIQAMVDYTHQKGLKFGIHLMRGIPRKAVDEKAHIEGTIYTADQIADTNSTCVWCNYNYGIDMSKPGAQEYYDSLIRKMADWKIDFIKYDDITAFPQEVAAVQKAIKKVNYPIALSLSPGGDSTIENMKTYQDATMLRVTEDIWDDDLSLEHAFIGLNKYYQYAQKDFFIDLDMLCIGHLRLNMPNDIVEEMDKNNRALAGEGRERMSRLSKEQQRSFMAVRAICASPLLIGSDLPTIDKFSLQLLTNEEMILCNQLTRACKPLAMDDFIAWQSDAGYIAIFNCDNTSKVFNTGKLNCTSNLFDVWERKQIALNEDVTINGNDVLFLKAAKS